MENQNMEDIFNNALGGEVKKQPTQTQQPKQEVQQPVAAKAPNLKTQVANAIVDKNVSDKLIDNMLGLMAQNQMSVPNGYQIGNELKSAYYAIVSDSNKSKCDVLSIANSLSDMAIQGLSYQKHQVYFIPYGGQLSCQRSYFGDIALAKRTGLIADVNARVIYQGDTYEMDTDENGNEFIKNHKSALENRDNPIIGAYAWATGINGYKLYAIMTKKEIQSNWNLSKDSSRKFQNNFPQEASKRTVIRRLLKNVFNTAVDLTPEQQQAMNAYNKGVEEEYKNDDFKYSDENTINAHVHEETGEIISDEVFND